MKSKTGPQPDIARTLGIDNSSGHSKFLRRWLPATAIILVPLAVVILWKTAGTTNSLQYKTQEVQRGDLTVTVTATGNLEPTNQVDVGSELSGIIRKVEVDYNDRVKIGQVLARLDTDKLEAEVLQSKAALESAQAKLLEAKAGVREAENELARLKSVREMSGGKVPSQHDMDAAEAALQCALAAEASAEAGVSGARATLEANGTDLAKTVIYSPVNGVVLLRNIEPGQTVAASLQAPVLFTLAEDLTRMELHVDVDEADVGQVKEGQEAVFTVDAYPDRTFPARITQVRYGSQTVDGVVTYETVLNVDNSNLYLRPGMTATADITVKEVQNAILIPNSALRFMPPVQEEQASKNNGGLLNQLLPRPGRFHQRQRRDTGGDKKQDRVWTLRDGHLAAISITTGSTDGIMTEVTGGDIEPGMAVVVDTVSVNR
jgi:HlyD family secretion protein